MTATISARIDADKKRQAEELFAEFGLSLSTAINLFINQALSYQGIPFELRRKSAKDQEMLDAMAEAKRLSRDPRAKRYTDIDELFADALK
jgi:DNA-damage-inducible protein J